MNTAAKVVLVTGASSGIGKATAIYLAQQGYRVFAGVRRPEQVSLPAGIELVALDVNNEASCQAAVASLVARAGRIDVLVNNAGGSLLGALEEVSVAQAQALFDTNVFGILRMSQAVLGHMRAQGSGKIVNISSILGFLPAPYMGVYAATKHAVEGLSESMDHEVRRFGVRVAIVQPGFTKTNIDAAAPLAETLLPVYAAERERVAAGVGLQVKNAPDPVVVARVIERAIQAKRFVRYTVGPEAGFLSGAKKWMPGFMLDMGLRKSFGLA
jgi:NAD(P)-dependent dehydrogenase (short-subunit alcohol dehydrogenase family)